MTQDSDFKRPIMPLRRLTKSQNMPQQTSPRSASSPITPNTPSTARFSFNSSSPVRMQSSPIRPTTPTPNYTRSRAQFSNHYETSFSQSRSRSRSRGRGGFSPDRFIPSSVNLQSFRMGVDANLLSDEERYTRKRSASPMDPFSRRRGVSPAGRRASADAGFGRTISGNVRRGRSRTSDPGLGGEGLRGMNVIEANMFKEDNSEEEENARHEERLALALGVDRAGKVLNFSGDPSGSPKNPKGIKGRGRAETMGAGAGSAQMWGYGEGNPRLSRSLEAEKPAYRQVPTSPFR